MSKLCTVRAIWAKCVPHKIILLCSIFAGSLTYVPSLVTARTNDGSKIVGHLLPHVQRASRDVRCAPEQIPSCKGNDIRANGQIHKSYDLYLILLGSNLEAGVSGIEFGIEYNDLEGDGLKVFSWLSCAQTQVTSSSRDGKPWLSSGSGILLVLDEHVTVKENASNGSLRALLGAFYVYAYGEDTFSLTAHPRYAEGFPWEKSINVTDKHLVESWLTYPDNIGNVVFGPYGDSFSPCSSVPLKENSLPLENTSQLTVRPGKPNPFHSRIEWEISSQKTREADINIFSVSGALVKTWHTTIQAGTTKVSWDGRNDSGLAVAPGKYYLLIKGEDGYRATRAAVLLK